MSPRDTVPPSADDTDRCPALPLELASTLPAPPMLEEPEHEPFAIVRPVTFLPTFDLSAEDLEEP